MKKTFTVKGWDNGKHRFTTDEVRTIIENTKRDIKNYEWDLENYYDIPTYVTEEKLKRAKKHLACWTEVLEIAIKRGWDKELEEV